MQELLQAAKSVAKVDAVEKSLAELAENLRVKEAQAKHDIEKLSGDLITQCLLAAKGVTKVEVIERNVAEHAESLRVLEAQAKQDIEKLNGDLLNGIDALGTQHI